jgi:hypothetical protein
LPVDDDAQFATDPMSSERVPLIAHVSRILSYDNDEVLVSLFLMLFVVVVVFDVVVVVVVVVF